jgi:endonuclease/exonuclease/phosphatase family metal-dependent hydrolase
MRVLQLNIWARSGPYETREPLLKKLFTDLAPDLIALQEVDVAPNGSNQATELLDGLGYEVFYDRRIGTNRGDPGIAIASRHPILDRSVRELGHDGVAIGARIAIGEEALWFACAVPLSWLPGREGEREDECIALDEWLTDLAKEDLLPPILAGDFDATPDAASIRFLTGLQSLQGKSTYWADAFAIAGDGSPGYTWSTSSSYVQPFAEAVFAQPVHHRRIDYVFVGSPVRWKPRIVVRACRVVGTENDGAAPSDHYGVVADLEIDGDSIGRGQGLGAWEATHDAIWPPPAR